MALRAFPTGKVRVTVLSPLKLTVVALSKTSFNSDLETWYLSWYQEVEKGSNEDDTIDVEAWTTLSEAPGSWTANDEDTKKIQPYPLQATRKCGPSRAASALRRLTSRSYAVREGLVEPSASDTPEKLYDWTGVVFVTDYVQTDSVLNYA
ncbi:hypothetical protein C8J57DRAFT_1242193 [Mycena rebaudengoi]|nr:hypothetical protein C8J57DRAFT_1242193 [Mycena rebaudengoi]